MNKKKSYEKKNTLGKIPIRFNFDLSRHEIEIVKIVRWPSMIKAIIIIS